jgi:methylenetetrahydrofolate dehydrogenase (NADP+)/methenyltetrahydrofolate cyclohydrolase
VTALLLDGRPIARDLLAEAKTAVVAQQAAGGPLPQLVVVQVGEDPAAVAYVRSIVRASESAGIQCAVDTLPARTSAAALRHHLAGLNGRRAVHGILLAAPLPAPLVFAEVAEGIAPEKDVDGAHAVNLGRLAAGRTGFAACTPEGGLELLRRYGIPVAGKNAVVVGRGMTVGRPLAMLLLQHDATVTICHSRSVDLPALTRRADLLFVAAGRPALITGSMVQPSAVVVDFGINVLDSGLVGDVAFDEVREIASAITPVPGGTGPVTNAVLVQHVVEAARVQAGSKPTEV